MIILVSHFLGFSATLFSMLNFDLTLFIFRFMIGPACSTEIKYGRIWQRTPAIHSLLRSHSVPEKQFPKVLSKRTNSLSSSGTLANGLRPNPDPRPLYCAKLKNMMHFAPRDVLLLNNLSRRNDHDNQNLSHNCCPSPSRLRMLWTSIRRGHACRTTPPARRRSTPRTAPRGRITSASADLVLSRSPSESSPYVDETSPTSTPSRSCERAS